jgi:RecB family exonuclease
MECPLRAKLKHLEKRKEPPSPAAERGQEIHTLAEKFVKGQIKKIPLDLKNYSKEIEDLKKRGASAEHELAFTEKWKLTDWFSKETWLRIKVDVMYLEKKILHIIDYKTGKPRESNSLQLSLYALGGFLWDETVETVRASLWYLDHKDNKMTSEFRRKQLPDLKTGWTGRVAGMMADRSFKPRPGRHCHWCPFSKAKGGPCKF